jgi:glucose-6-phosphate 1-epimerase
MQQSMQTLDLYTASGARCTVMPLGATVVSWCPAGGKEQLFMSRLSGQGGLPVRGGIPVVFPQFAEMGHLPKHGLVRDVVWELVTCSQGEQISSLLLRTQVSEASLALWPFAYTLHLHIELYEQTLRMTLEVTNSGTQAFQFQAALHTYFQLQQGVPVTVHGLAQAGYIDKLQQIRMPATGQTQLSVNQWMDRIYLDTATPLRLTQAEHTVQMSYLGFSDVVLWTPWQQGVTAIPDIADDEGCRMLCIEPACIAQPPLLPAGGVWRGSMVVCAGPAAR